VRRQQEAQGEYQGLFISEQEVDRLLGALGDCRSEKRQDNFGSRLDALRHAFQLSDLDVDALLICLAPEIDLGYQRLYAYLQDDVTRRHPSLALVLDLLDLAPQAKGHARQRLGPHGSLVRHGFVELFADAGQHLPPLLGKFLRADDGIVSYLLGSDEVDWRLAPYAIYVTPRAILADLGCPSDLKQRLLAMTQQAVTRPGLTLAYFQGARGAGKRTIAESLCREVGAGCLLVRTPRLAALDAGESLKMVRLAVRESRLRGLAPYWDRFDAVLGDDKEVLREAILKELSGFPGLAILSGEAPWEPGAAAGAASFVRVEFPRPSYAERLELWSGVLNGTRTAELDLEALANKFRFSGAQIRDAAATAKSRAGWRNPVAPEIGMGDLYEACRLHSQTRLSELARKIRPHQTWTDIVLPPDRMEQLREIASHVKFRSLIYDEWGFGRRLSLGKGLNVLFAGPSGTGKTMAAEIIAGDLGLEMYKIDLSSVVSKYIGETEKNLARVFAEAETSNAILFFDEADALFGKRSEVRDAHDRYANIEIGYLLQRMDEYEGVVILSTNLRKNMDDAFARRMQFVVEFPFPDAADRQKIWEKIWPAETPRDPALDFPLLARSLEIAGGNIRNIVVAGVFLAAAEGALVGMPHLLRAARREYQKMGMLVAESDLARS
jgi:AAA+ superfamily predicted ATPase